MRTPDVMKGNSSRRSEILDAVAALEGLPQRCGKLGHFVDLAYSGCMVIKTQLPKIGSKFDSDEFRINSLCMSFYNHITTDCRNSRTRRSEWNACWHGWAESEG